MTPQERDVISGIFDRLKSAANAPRDVEAEKLIAEHIARQPHAPYVMAQQVYVMEQALGNLNQQVEQLQAQVQQLQRAPQQSGGFLSGLFGGSKPAPQAAPAYQQQPMAQQQPMQQQAGPWGAPQQQAAPAKSGFLGQAMTTAAGVAGGMVLGSVLMNAFSGGGSSRPHGSDASQGTGDTTVNNYYDGSQDSSQQAASNDQSYQDASYDNGGGGGDDSWA